MDLISLCNKCEDALSFSLEDLPSNYFELLRANYVPMPAEAARYKQSMKNAERVLLDNDRMIEVSHSNRDDIKEHIELCSALVSPVRRLPNELLGATFAHLSDSLTFLEGRFRGSDIWRIRQVCTRWRDVVTSTTSFWSHLTFLEHLDDQDYVQYNRQLIDLLLGYSQNAPLHIAFEAADYEDQHPEGFLGDFVKRVADRIQYLTLNPLNFAALTDISNFPVLRTLEIDDRHIRMAEVQGGFQSMATCFQNSPNLHSLKYNHFPPGSYIGLRWESIEKISLNTFSTAHLAFIPANFPNLSHLELSPYILREVSATLCFPCLAKLTLNLFAASCRGSEVSLLERFDLPVLRALEIITEVRDNDKFFFKSFRSLLSYHSNTLLCLSWTNAPSLSGSQLLSILAVLPRLRRFTYKVFPEYDFDGQAFSTLLTSRADALISELEDLQIEGKEIVIDSPVIEGLVNRRSRQSGPDRGPLKKLSLTFKKVEFRENALSELERLRSDGLIVCINGVYSNWQ